MELVCYLVGVMVGFITGYLFAAQRYMSKLAEIFDRMFPENDDSAGGE